MSYAHQGCIYLIQKYIKNSNIVKYYYNLKFLVTDKKKTVVLLNIFIQILYIYIYIYIYIFFFFFFFLLISKVKLSYILDYVYDYM